MDDLEVSLKGYLGCFPTILAKEEYLDVSALWLQYRGGDCYEQVLLIYNNETRKMLYEYYLPVNVNLLPMKVDDYYYDVSNIAEDVARSRFIHEGKLYGPDGLIKQIT